MGYSSANRAAFVRKEGSDAIDLTDSFVRIGRVPVAQTPFVAFRGADVEEDDAESGSDELQEKWHDLCHARAATAAQILLAAARANAPRLPLLIQDSASDSEYNTRRFVRVWNGKSVALKPSSGAPAPQADDDEYVDSPDERAMAASLRGRASGGILWIEADDPHATFEGEFSLPVSATVMRARKEQTAWGALAQNMQNEAGKLTTAGFAYDVSRLPLSKALARVAQIKSARKRPPR